MNRPAKKDLVPVPPQQRPGGKPGGPGQGQPGAGAGSPPPLPPCRALTVPPQLSDKARRRYADFLPENQAVVERSHSPVARILTWVLAVLVISLVTYISIAEVDQVANAPGVVRPNGRVKVVNHPEGGRVVAINVREGDHVTEGQVLLELDREVMGEEVGKRRAQWLAAEFQVARLMAEAAGQVPSFDAALSAERPDLAAAETALFNARNDAITSKRQQADEQVRQRAQDVTTLEGRVKQQQASLDILRAQVESLKKLKEQGYFPELRYLSVLRELSDAEGQLAETLSQLESARSALEEAKKAREGVDRDWQSQVQTELSDALARRDQAKASLAQGDSALKNLVVLSPAEGIVQELKVNNLGQAVAPNQEMMKIVPVGDQLIIEAKVANVDISKIQLGQEARVKITTYNYVRYGVLDGKVDQISPDATKDEKTGQLLFSVYVKTDKNYLGEEPGQFPVSPGMTAEVDLVIGKRTILSYLTDRLRQTAISAFSEN